ncbi:NADP-dependent oxidoreductase domain-containing protein [Aspergillus crustosus]
MPRPERTTIGEDTEMPRMISGLWQLAGGHDENLNIETAAQAMNSLINAGLDCFDMADHYGDAELVMGKFRETSQKNMTAFTKWCPPENGDKSFEQAEKAIDRALERMGQSQITLLQYHIWDYSDDTYWNNFVHLQSLQKQGKIKHLGLTNTDAAHLELLLDSGIKIATNQVSCSVIDRRVAQGRLGKVCLENGVGVLAYGTLLGGYLSEKWLGQPEPQNMHALNWSLRKYLRFIRAAGGWQAFQGVLQALSEVSHRHNVSIAAVATRYVLDLPPVSAVIVGSRLSAESDKYTERNLSAFSFKLTENDYAIISKAQEALTDIPGDCGDEYRRAPFLTATGDLSDHIKASKDTELQNAVAAGMRIEYSSGSKWEPIAGYCRAVRTGDYIRVSGTTANSPVPSRIPVLGGSSAGSQTVAVLDIIGHTIKALGGSLSDVVRTRIMVANEADCEAVSRAHGWVFNCEGVRPANTLVTAGLIGLEFLVEIEAEAQLGCTGVFRTIVMAIPSDITIKTLKGSWTLDKSITDDSDGILKLQGVAWLIRKGIGAATTTLQFTSTTEPSSSSPSSSSSTEPATNITMRQTLTGGIPGSSEERITDWVERERANHIYGNVQTRSRLVNGVKDENGAVRPELEVQSKTDVKAVEEEIRGYLRGGEPYLVEAGKEVYPELYIHDFGRNEKGGWTAEQIWSIEVIEEQPYLTRRVAVVKEDGYELARLVYKFSGL